MRSRTVFCDIDDDPRATPCFNRCSLRRMASTKKCHLYFLLGLGLLMVVLAGCAGLPPATEEDVIEDVNVMTFPLSTFDDYKAHYYTYADEGRLIKFFILKSSDRVVRAAFDACDICYKAKKGFRQEGNDMICNECGRHFPSDKINEVSGGCNPAPLRRTIDGERLVIDVTDIAAGWRYF